MKYLIVDGMFSGTGIRDSIEGGYMKPQELGLSLELIDKILLWLSPYENAHYTGYTDKKKVAEFDSATEIVLKDGSEEEFRRVAELYKIIDSNSLKKYIERIKNHGDVAIQEIATDFE